MKVCSRSLMKVQQAPLPVQAALLLPDTVASKIIQSRKGGTTSHSSTSTSSVSSVLAIELKRLRRSQSSARRVPRSAPPVSPSSRPRAAACVGVSAVMTAGSPPVACSPLHQGDVAVVPIHEGGEEQVDGEEDGHDDDDGLDLLVGLVHHRAGEELEYLGIGDGGAERAALDQVEVLAGELRHHHAQGLRQHDEEEQLSAAQPERARRLRL